HQGHGAAVLSHGVHAHDLVAVHDQALAFGIHDDLDVFTASKRILERLDGKNVRAVVDATGELLLRVLKYKPFLVKPNNFELAELFDVNLENNEQIAEYARKLKEMGAQNVLVSMAEKGALLVDENDTLHVSGVCKGTVKNSVGAGDSMVAGFIAGLEQGGYDHALKLGTVCGGATTFSEGLATGEEIRELLKQLQKIGFRTNRKP
ncbi:MAG: bifunctional hydroxymethylpyrimidine kinase/phosphomethylpyrimidine kinase, partial [Oscillospiraceae bacterium]|nr:bifunctional hydroxymethylpyrimidine kinase/phosphomethylpyrimidine kinase [Oscillospiraceae bacterium]